MITTLLITDLTRMLDGKVCIAGYDLSGRCIRPVFNRWRISEDWLWSNNQPVIQPFALVDLDLIAPRPVPPHSEDWVVDEKFRVFRGRLSEKERLEWLAGHCDPSVQSIFGAEIHQNHGYYLRAGCGSRSLGMVKVDCSISLVYEPKNWDGHERWDYRINFVDESGQEYCLPITDLSYRYYLDYLRVKHQRNPRQITACLGAIFGSGPLYLRLGLTRSGWEKHPDCYHLQVNAIYSTPDYLRGKTFADYAPKTNGEPPGW